jgi:putative transcriptional regulator
MKEALHNRIKAHRLARALTQQELATETGVSRQSIISVERGRYVPSLPLALKLAGVFNCPVEDLFRLEES